MDYLQLAKLYYSLTSTTKTLEKTAILAEFLKKVPAKDTNEVVTLLQGRVFPEYDSREVGIGSQLAVRAIASASGRSIADITDKWKNIGDLGEVAEQCIKATKQATLFSQKLTVTKVIDNIQRLAETEGSGSVERKIRLITELLSSADPLAAKFIIRTLLSDLRIGIGAGTIRDSIAKAYEVDKSLVQKAYDLSTNLGRVAETAKTQGKTGLEEIDISIHSPLKVMHYQKAKDIEDAFERVGRPAAIEYKYDGFHVQIHKSGREIKLFTRNLEEVTAPFPDVAAAAKKAVKARSYILDVEVIGLDRKTGNWLPFQAISQRIKRKHDIDRTAKEIPVVTFVFDIMALNGKSVIHKPFKERRKLIKKIITSSNEFQLAKQIVTTNSDEARKFYDEALKMGHEGAMFKNLDAEYMPGSRVGYGVKVKQVMETLDLVIVGAEWGTGKRANWLSSFMLACREGSQFQTIGKMGTGIKEKTEQGTSFEELTMQLKPDIIKEKGKTVYVKPRIVLEIAYEEIQRSPTYESGFALRFPRLVRLRPDRSPSNASTLFQVKDFYAHQRNR